MGRILTFRVGTAGYDTFEFQYSADGGLTWYPVSSTLTSPSTSDACTPFSTGVDADGYWDLDGVNLTSGNFPTATERGAVYRFRYRSEGAYGNWSDPFLMLGYPEATDLLEWLEGAGLTVATALKKLLTGAVVAARQDFEKDTGRRMLAGAAETRYFDPPTDRDSVLFLDQDLLTLTSVVYQPTGATSETLTRNEDYWLEPLRAGDGAEPAPYTRVRFARDWMQPLDPAVRRSLRVTGRWGYRTSLPDDAWTAMVARAGWRLYGQIELASTGGLLSFSEGDLRVDYGVERWKTARETWAGTYAEAVAHYARADRWF